MYNGLVARRLYHQLFPLLGHGGGRLSVGVTDASASAQRDAPWVGRVVLRPWDVSCDQMWAIVVDKALPGISQERLGNDAELLSSEGCSQRVGCRGLAGLCLLVGDRRQQLFPAKSPRAQC